MNNDGSTVCLESEYATIILTSLEIFYDRISIYMHKRKRRNILVFLNNAQQYSMRFSQKM